MRPSPATDRSILSVVLPVSQDNAAFRRALAALAETTPPPDEVVVVCDGPAPEAAAAARAFGFRVVERDVAAGPAAARNAGAARAAGDLLLFVDADVAVHANLIGRVRDAMADRGVHAVVGCYDAVPPEPNFLSQYKHLLQRFVHLHARPIGTTFWGACGAIRREAFEAVGGFDERFTTPCVEDIDLGYRLVELSYRIRFVPTLEVTHLKRWTLGSLLRSDVFRRALPWTWVLMRESKVHPDLNLRYRSWVAGALSLALWASIPAALVDVRALVVTAAAAALLALIDSRLWRFFRELRGSWFACGAIVWHWFHYLYSSTALFAAILLYPIVGRRVVGAPGVRPAAIRAPRRETT
jgi:GT2 family glycosyltransferase